MLLDTTAKILYPLFRPIGLKQDIPLSKGEQTREMILQRAAQVFNRRGYFGTSLTDIMAATGLEKGGIYNHFKSKDDLALQTFDYSVDLIRQEFATAIKGKRNAIERLIAIMGVYRALSEGSPVIGGCPILNTAIEADDAHPALHQRARQSMEELRDFIRRIVTRGIERQEIRPEVDPDSLATLMMATLEGAIMLARLYEDPVHMDRAINYLTGYLETSVQP
jgi:TetR/AcrR family transcriptional regulator, transcriptional repressor for nem operon